jgi:hypothetical protein
MHPFHLAIRRPISIAVLACLALVCFVSLTSRANAEVGTEHRFNVSAYYGTIGLGHTLKSYVMTYNAQHEWVSTTEDMRFIVEKSTVSLDPLKGERLVSGYIDYGTVNTPVFKDIRWTSFDPIPLYKYLKDASGKTHKTALSGVTISLYNPLLPLPEATKGAGVVAEEPSGEMK